MSWYEFEKTDIGFNLSFYLFKIFIQLHYSYKDVEELKKLSYYYKQFFKLEDLFFREKH